ncbi:uncharacterized protein RCO7_07793 [Rhynchosporium graminicola]|uniref:Uncharacterized protein n=1 Tax=Rhynchosporium graminicola TaxID=2792576 RepID=A0A1E1K9D5_9HELO|nr:uncharacterized protein RCO7_07793 [Rhynchosporium commune]
MNTCTIYYGSSTAKCFATSTRSHFTLLSSSSKVRVGWKLSGACQTKGISSTSQPTPESTSLENEHGFPRGPASGTDVAANVDSTAHETTAKETCTISKSQSSSEGNFQSTFIHNASTIDSPSSASTDVPKQPFKRRPLPLSPLMNPAILQAKQKRNAAKLSPTRTPTPFQQQLARNPFARALGTPVRRCAVSGTKLPNFFLQGFRVMSDPETGEPWYVPTKLANKHLSVNRRESLDEAEELDEEGEWNGSKGLEEIENSTEVEVVEAIEQSKKLRVVKGVKDSEDSAEATDLNGSNQLAEAEEMDRSEASKELIRLKLEFRPSTIGYQAYTLNRNDLLKSLLKTGKKSSRNKPASTHNMLMPMSWRGVKSAQKSYEQSGWRQDMQDFVPMIMGRRISEALTHIGSLKRGYLVGCTGWEDALTKKQIAAFLWTGGKGDREVKVEGSPEFATLDVGSEDFDANKKFLGRRKQKIPVYNLQMLLGEEKMDELRRIVPNSVFEKELVVLRHKNATVKLQLQLWKIQGYLAEHPESQFACPERTSKNTHEDEPTEPSLAGLEEIR